MFMPRNTGSEPPAFAKLPDVVRNGGNSVTERQKVTFELQT
jgi:hypothetical protein